MESIAWFVMGLAGFLIGVRIIMRARSSWSRLDLVGGSVLALFGMLLLVNGLWSAGTLVGDDGSGADRIIVDDAATSLP